MWNAYNLLVISKRFFIYANEDRDIVKSSKSVSADVAKMYNRVTSPEDPWLSLADHEDSGDGEDEGTLYGENSRNGHTHWLSLYGANVFIRNSVNCAEAGMPLD